MATTRIPSPKQPTVDFGEKCDEWFQRAEEQKMLAMEMVERMREMHRRAVEMTKPPRVFLP